MKGKDWNLEITAPPELHKPIQELFDAITWAIKRSYVGNNKEIIMCRDCKYRNERNNR